eukprot:3332924-Pyramimonas_sp.AAC.1
MQLKAKASMLRKKGGHYEQRETEIAKAQKLPGGFLEEAEVLLAEDAPVDASGDDDAAQKITERLQ